MLDKYNKKVEPGPVKAVEPDRQTGKPAKPVSLFAAAHPFKTERIDRTVIAGGSIADILKECGLGVLLDPAADVRLFVDDMLMPSDCWGWYTPEPGQIICLRVLPTGGGSGKDVLRGVMMIAVLAMSLYAPFAASAILGTNVGNLGGGLITAGVGLGGMLAVNALIPPAIPTLSNQGDGIGAPGGYITSTQNRANLYGPVPRVFGTHKLYPPLAAEPWTENFGADSYLRMLFCVGMGEYEVLEANMKIGETALTSYSDYEQQVWNTADGDPVTQLFPSDVREAPLSVQIEYLGGPESGGWYEQTTADNIHEITLDITFPSGLWQQYDSGRVRSKTVTFEARYSVAGADSWTAFDESPLDVDTKAHHRYSVGFRAADLAEEQYDVQVRRTTEDEAGSGVDVLNADSYWTVLRSITYTAPFELDNTTLVALRIKASGQLSGVLNQFSCIASAKVPTYTASAWTANTATRSPAWAFAEVLRGDANLRAVADAKIDGDILEGWADYCTDEVLYFDAVIDSKTTVFELLRIIAAAGRASFAIIDNKYAVVQDVEQTVPRQHFSPRNSWGFSGHKSFIDTPHGIKCRFINSAAEYRQDEIIVYDDDYDADNSTIFETMDFYGVTTADHIWKQARYHIAVGRLRPETFEFYTDAEWITCVRGDMVRLTHDVLLIGLGQARIKAIAGSDVTLDSSITMAGGSTYGAQIRKADGTMLDTTITLDVGEQTVVTLGSVSGVAVGDLIFFGVTDAESMDCIVTRIDPGPKLSAHLWLVPASPAIHDADTGEIPEYDPIITLPPPDDRTPPTPTIESVTLSTASSINDDNLDVIVLAAVDFSVDTTDPNLIWPANFQGQYRTVESGPIYGEWITQPTIDGALRVFECQVENGATYDFRVRSVSEFGITSAWDTESNYTVNYSFTVPEDITGLALVGGGSTWPGRDVELTWDEPSDLYKVARYKLNIYKTAGTVLLRTKYIEVGDANSLFSTYTFDENYEDNSGSPIGALTFRIWAISPQTEPSAGYDSLVVTHTAPTAISGLAALAFRGGVLFYWDENTDAAFSHFAVQITVEDDSASGWLRQHANTFSYTLTDAEVTEHGAAADIQIEVKAVDIFGTESATDDITEAAGTLFVQITDIDDFPDILSNTYLVPVVIGLTITDDTPANGITWDAHSLWYDGTEYEISGGSTTNTYVYFKDLATTYVESDTHPADDETPGFNWDPTEDFIIMVNDDGAGQPAWYSMANAVIGSAYIKAAAIQDLHVDEISGVKITAGTITLTGLGSDVTGQLAASYNLAKNGEFKKDTDAETDPTDWDVVNTGTPAVSKVWAPTGVYLADWDKQNALVYYANCDNGSEMVRLTSEDYIAVNHAMDYCLSAWVRGVQGTRSMYLGLFYYDTDYVACSPTSYQWMAASNYSPATSWHQIEGICYNSSSGETNLFPSDCAYVKIRCYVQYQAVGANLVGRITFNEGRYPQRGVTVIDGGNIYTDTISANQINGAGFGTLTISSGKIAINTTDALEIQAGGNMKVLAGGDVGLYGHLTDPSKLLFYDSGSTLRTQIYSNAVGYTRFYPGTDTEGSLEIGWSDMRFEDISIISQLQFKAGCVGGGDDSSWIECSADPITHQTYQHFHIEADGVNGGLYLVEDEFYPYYDSTTTLGTDSKRWSKIFGDRLDLKSDPGASTYMMPIENDRSSGALYGIYIWNTNSTDSSGHYFNCSRDDPYDERFYVENNGDCYNTNDVYGQISDIRLKENIIDCTPKLNDILKLKIRNFNFKNDPDLKQIGLVSQEFETVFPALVTENDQGFKRIKTSVLVPMIIKAIQELNQKIDSIRQYRK